jgi:hypothetical protein
MSSQAHNSSPFYFLVKAREIPIIDSLISISPNNRRWCRTFAYLQISCQFRQIFVSRDV